MNFRILNSKKILIVNFLLFFFLAASLVHESVKIITNSWFCFFIIALLLILNYKLYFDIKTKQNNYINTSLNNKLKLRCALVATVISTTVFLGLGPISRASGYSVDDFSRIIGTALVQDYSVSKKISYFYCSLIIYLLLFVNIYFSARLAVLSNLRNDIRRLKAVADTLLIAGFSFLLICIYRKFSGQFGYDFTYYVLKIALIICLPAFYYWQRGRLTVADVRYLLCAALFSFVLATDIVAYFDIKNVRVNFHVSFLCVALPLLALMISAKHTSKIDLKAWSARLVCLALIGAFLLILFSVLFETSNVLALYTDRFVNIKKIDHVIFYTVAALSLAGVFLLRKIKFRKRLASWAPLLFVCGAGLIQSQPSLLFHADVNIFESANFSLPVSDFLNFGKIPLFENFPGHGISGVLSAVIYGLLSHDHFGAQFVPWVGWLYGTVCIVVLFLLVKKLSNAFVAFCCALLLPYVLTNVGYYGIGLAALIPFTDYLRTYKRKYAITTALISLFLIAYRLDIGFAFFAAILLSFTALCLLRCEGAFKAFKQLLLSYAIGILVILALFLLVCLLKDINPIFRMQQYLQIISSNVHWGYATLGNTETNAYPFFYFVVPVLSCLCLLYALAKRAQLRTWELAVLLALLFAYYANLPRIMVRHSLAEYVSFMIPLWLWTVPIACSFALSKAASCRSFFILGLAVFALAASLVFQSSVSYGNATLANVAGRAEQISSEVRSETRKHDIAIAYGSGTRALYNDLGSPNAFHAAEIKALADLLLEPGETYFDFTNQNAAYALNGRESPVYITQSPSMLSGEGSQRALIKELEQKLDKVPLVLMPANEDWYFLMHLDGISNNIRHYLVAEWLYSHYRPLVSYNSFASVWVLNSRYEEFRKKVSDKPLLQSRDGILMDNVAFPSALPDGGQIFCHNCKLRMQENGLLITPTGPDPYLMGFEQFFNKEVLKKTEFVSLDLGQDAATGFQLFYANDNAPGYAEGRSSFAIDITGRRKVFYLRDFNRTSGATEQLRIDFPEKTTVLIKSASLSSTTLSKLSLIDWGYDSPAPHNAVPQGAELVSNAHDYDVGFLPYVWGQFDSEHAADHADLMKVQAENGYFVWDDAGQQDKPAYLRVEIDAGRKLINGSPDTYIKLGSLKNGSFTPLGRFRFKLKKGHKVYLFRVSADYYWHLSELNALQLDPNLKALVTSVRVIEGD